MTFTKKVDFETAKKTGLLPSPWVEGKDKWIEMHDMSWKLAIDHIRHHEGLASPWYMDEAHTEDRVWQWDTCFMALYSQYAPEVLPGMPSLDNFYNWQRDDGFISMTHFIADGKPAYGERINPQLYAWIEWENYLKTGETDRFEKCLPVLCKYYEWIKENRRRGPIITPHSGDTNPEADNEGGLYWSTCCGAAGCDNSPRSMHLGWNGGELCWIDTSAFQALSALYISRMAGVTGNKKINQEYLQEYSNLKDLINKWMWCEKSSFYHDIFMDGNYFSAKTAVSFYPLLANIPNQAQAEGVLSHLRDPNEFWRPHPVPTLSYDDPNYVDSGAYWLGGVWAPTNTMIIKGLEQYGMNDTAFEIAVKHLDAIAETHDKYSPATIWEAYSPEDTAKPATKKDMKSDCKKDFCGWSSLGGTTLLYETIMGFKTNVPENKLTLHHQLENNYGIDNFPFGKDKLNISCKNRNGKLEIKIESTVEFEFAVNYKGEEKNFGVMKGENCFAV
ncbi:MAG: MGH1-like glycoside hydrolase domain-containing protein [Planctomycetota bacterium]|jgi:hypothetical protein